MNVLFTTPTYYPHNGGAESFIADLATTYAKQGHYVTVITSRTDDTLASRETRDGVDIVRIKYPPPRVNGIRDAWLIPSRVLWGLVQIWGVIRRKRIDTVCLGLVGRESFLVLLLHHLLRFKLIVYIHGGEIRSYIRISPLIRWTLRRSLKACYAAIAVSDELRQETIAFAPAVEPRITVIPPGIPLDEIARVTPYEHHRKYLLFVGRLQPVKNVEVLIEAFQQASERLRDFDLIIVGTGPLETSLRKQVSQHESAPQIVFLGDQKRSTVFALMKACEFLVLPSLAEGCPLTVLEAIALGKLTIGSKVKGIAEIIQDDQNGALFEAGNPEALSSLLIRYAADASMRRRIETNIQSADLQPYDLPNVADRHLRVYRGLSERLRICLITSFYYEDENCAGLSSYYFNLAQSLVDHGAEVSLVTSAGSGNHNDKIRTFEVKRKREVENSAQRSTLAGFSRVAARLRFSADAYLKVRQLSQTRGLDMIVAPELFAPGLFVSFFDRKKLFTRIHTPTYIGDSYNGRSQLIGKTLSVIEKAQARRSQGLSVASESLANLIANDWRIPRQAIQVIPNSVQVEWVRQLGASQAREISEEYLLYFGRVEKRKGVEVIAHALPAIMANCAEIRMVFVGRDAGLKDEILRINHGFRDRIIFIDTVEKRRLFGIIHHAKLVLLPSLFENMSNAGLEAMALGRPIIGTFKTSFAEIIQDNVNGFLVEPGDPRALSRKVLSCLERSDLESVGERAYRSVLQFDSSQIVSRNLAFYRKALAGRVE